MSRSRKDSKKLRKTTRRKSKNRNYSLRQAESLENREMLTAAPSAPDLTSLPDDYRGLITTAVQSGPSESFQKISAEILAADTPPDNSNSSLNESSPQGPRNLQRGPGGGSFNGVPIRTSPFEPLHNPSDGGGSNETLVDCGNVCATDYRADYLGINDDSARMVYLAQGEFTISRTDLTVPSTGMNFSFTRTYRSGNVFDSHLGMNWDHNYNRRIVPVDANNLNEIQITFPNANPGDVVRMDGSGRADLFRDNQNGTYQAPNELYWEMRQEPATQSFIERSRDGIIVEYELANDFSGFYMSSLQDRNGNAMQFQRGADGRVETAFDTLGRSYQFGYNQDRLSSLTDFSGRTIDFNIVNGQLESVTSPVVLDTPNGNDFPNGRTEAYGYDSAGRLNGVVAPNEAEAGGAPRVHVTYNTNNQVEFLDVGGTNSSNLPAGTVNQNNRIQFNYQPNMTTVTDRLGNVTQYEFANDRIAVVREMTNGVRPSDPAAYETFYDYNQNGELVNVIRPEGNSIQYNFDAGNPDRLQQGNLLQIIESSGRRSGDQFELVTEFGYEPIYNQVFAVSDPRAFDPGFVPPLEPGFNDPSRYSSFIIFDYFESFDPVAIANTTQMAPADVINRLNGSPIPPFALGDVNGDGVTNQVAGNMIAVDAPQVVLDGASQQAGIAGGNRQMVTTVYGYNDFGQPIFIVDPELNVTEFQYYGANDPDGNGIIDNPGADATTGGYLEQTTRDAMAIPGSDNGTNPAAAESRSHYFYDEVGNVVREVDGRGVATDYFVNDLNEVLQVTRAAATGQSLPDPAEPLSLEAFEFTERFEYDANGNVIRHQVEDFGDTSNVGNPADINGDGAVDQIDAEQVLVGVQQEDPDFDFNADGITNILDYELYLVDIFGTQPGDANLDYIVDISDFNIWNSNKFIAGTDFTTADFNFDGITDISDFNLWNSNKFTLGPGPGYSGFVDYVFEYDILDRLVQTSEEVSKDEQLVTKFRYDANDNQVLIVLPEGNAVRTIYDERDLIFEEVRGAHTAPITTQLGVGDATDFDVRGGLESPRTYTYDGNRNVVELGDADDSDQSTANNAANGGDVTRFVYDGFDRLTSTIDAVGNQSVLQYDPAGNVIRELNFGPTGGISPTTTGISPGAVSVGGIVQTANLVNDNLLSSTEYLYDELNRLIQLDDVLFVNTIPTANPADVADGGVGSGVGKVDLTPGDSHAIPGVSAITINGRVTTRYEYDRGSRMTFITEDDGDTTRMDYDGMDRVIRNEDPEANIVEFAYDDNSNLIEMLETDVSQTAGVANEMFVTTYLYDSLNRQVQTVDNLGQSTTYVYDSRDNLVAIADANGPMSGETIARRAFAGGATTTNTINDSGNVTRYSYDGLNRMIRSEVYLTEDGMGDGTSAGASTFGLTDQVSHPESRKPQLDANQGGGDGIIRTGYVYDGNSNRVAQVDDQGNATVYLFDNLDRVVSETFGVTSDSTLDTPNLLGLRVVPTPTAATIDNPATVPATKLDNQLDDVETRLQAIEQLFPSLADTVSDPTTRIYGHSPDNETLIFEDENDSEFYRAYDGISRLVHERVFRAGQTDSHNTDPLFAPTPTTDPSNSSATTVVGSNARDYEYDGLSRRVRVTDNNDPGDVNDDSEVTSAYDSLGRVIEESQSLGNTTHVVDYGWRADDLVDSVMYPNGRTIEYTYDGLDRRATISDAGGDNLASDSYIGTWRLLERDYGNGTGLTYLDTAGTTVIGYDGLRRTVEMRHVGSNNSLLIGFSHDYDRVNNRTTEGKLHDPANDETFAYDSAYRLVDFRRDASTAGTITPQHQQIELDGIGNWSTVDGESRGHSNFNELVLRDSGTVTTYDYDDNGNQTSNGEFNFHYDAWNRLETVELHDGTIVADYDYDAMDRRVRKEVTNSGDEDGTTSFYYDGWQVIEERDSNDAVTQQYVYGTGIDEVILMDVNSDGGNSATSAGDQRLYFHQNDQSSTYGLTDATGTMVESYLYDAYGRTTTYTAGSNGSIDFGGDDIITVDGASSLDNPYLFTGRRLDGETGLHYYRNRFYNSDDGRFIHRDPMGIWYDTDSFGSGYAYAANSPVNAVDPYGLDSTWLDFLGTWAGRLDNFTTVAESLLGNFGRYGTYFTILSSGLNFIDKLDSSTCETETGQWADATLSTTFSTMATSVPALAGIDLATDLLFGEAVVGDFYNGTGSNIVTIIEMTTTNATGKQLVDDNNSGKNGVVIQTYSQVGNGATAMTGSKAEQTKYAADNASGKNGAVAKASDAYGDRLGDTIHDPVKNARHAADDASGKNGVFNKTVSNAAGAVYDWGERWGLWGTR